MSLNYDVLIIGTGIAGLSSAITLAEANLKVGLITRTRKPEDSNTLLAQGGIIYSQKEDDLLEQDINKASSNTSFDDALTLIKEKSGDILKEILLDKTKTSFSTDENNNLQYTKEAAHSKSRIIFKGDYTGKEIELSMLKHLSDKQRFSNVEILTEHTAIDLLTPEHHGKSIKQRYEDQKVVGAYVLNQKDGNVKKIIAKKTILATGGIAALYLHHSNADGSRGDGHAMAKRAGATLTNMEFIQFHPTTYFDRSSHRRFLITEAVRGEGGKLVNSEGKRFMDGIHPDKELAPRDIVSRTILEETIKTKHDCVYLDISHKDPEWIKKRFPTIYEHCLEKHIDITKAPIPVVPAAHYTCGGVKTDLNGKTTLNNLYAVGEVACTGLHGANRLASTALLEGLTFGHLAAKAITANINTQELYNEELIKNWEVPGDIEADAALIHQDWLTLKQTMWNYVGIIRSSNRLTRADAMFGELFDEIQRFYRKVNINDDLIGLRNAVETGYMVLGASSRNKESIGCFFRRD